MDLFYIHLYMWYDSFFIQLSRMNRNGEVENFNNFMMIYYLISKVRGIGTSKIIEKYTHTHVPKHIKIRTYI